MGTLTTLWSLAAGVSMALAAVYGLVWVLERGKHPSSLMLCMLGFAVAASTYLELCMMHSATTVEYGELLRWYYIPVFLALIAQALFVHYYLGNDRLWLLWTFIFARAVVLVVNFTVPPAFSFSNIVSLRHLTLLGEQVSVIGSAVPCIRCVGFAIASLLLLTIYFVDVASRQFRTGGRESKRKALTVAVGILVPMLCATGYTLLLVFGVVRAPISSVLWFFGALFVMAYELARELVISKHKAIELANLQSRFARAERANILGRLASALTHELSQPLSANAINAKAALTLLGRERSNVEELSGILIDIDSDSNRGIELVSRMRQLFKHGTIEMQPVRMEEVVRDVVALVGAEVTSKKVALSLLMQPDLPPISGDRVHLSQVLLNLLANSIHAVQSCPPDARRIVVAARDDNAKGEVEMSIRDSGHGIPDGIADKIFGPFFTTKSDGMGIGLTLSRTIVEAHGGRLWADQPPEQVGAVFRFTLRRA